MTEHYLQVKRTARFVLLGDPSERTEKLIIACHGYAQLARYFVRNFDPLLDNSTVIAAPEALSRFYTDGFFGKVGATWMTKEDREHEIEDYIGYLDTFYSHLIALMPQAAVHLVGFSQGCATISRWVQYSAPNFSGMYLIGGDLPTDIDWLKLKGILEGKALHLINGTNDPLIQPEQVTITKNKLNDSGIQFTEHWFEGKHEVNADALAKAMGVTINNASV
ncbi:MAG: hypothetical protein SFW35_00730 [Chitinophagales bacterium]|nr:hypothetical protein [Chitinophagales bacterium]